MIDYAAAGVWLEAYGTAWQTFDGDAWVALFTEDAEYHNDPFEPPLVGHNALRAYLLDAAASQRDVAFTVERHRASGYPLPPPRPARSVPRRAWPGCGRAPWAGGVGRAGGVGFCCGRAWAVGGNPLAGGCRRARKRRRG